MHLKWRGSVAVSSKEIGKLKPLSVWIHLMDNGQAFIRYCYKHSRRMCAVFLKNFHKRPFVILINGSSQKELLLMPLESLKYIERTNDTLTCIRGPG